MVARRVVSHQWRSAGRVRRLRFKAQGQRIAAPPGPDAIAVERAEHRLVRRAVDELGDTDREVLLLSAWEGLTHAEIAQVIGCSHAAADKRVARAKARLAHRYEVLAADVDADTAVPDGTTRRTTPDHRSPVRARKGGGDA